MLLAHTVIPISTPGLKWYSFDPLLAKDRAVPFVRQLPNLERLHDKLTLQKANTQYLSYGGQPSTIATLQEHGFAIYFRPLFSNLTTARRHHHKKGIILNV